ncbi:MAG: histidine kinase [Alphaproteobacteria bacterium]|nr:histidine kinase [Alphaproteobacteria bacterium]
MTRFLATDDNPNGWKLEDILSTIQDDIVRRRNKIIDDHRDDARRLLHNNIEILRLLTECIDLARSSTNVLASLGPSRAPGGPPRIGVI